MYMNAEEKRKENLRRRSVDFAIAARIFEGPVVTAEDQREAYGEARLRAVGQFEGTTYVVAYTFRGEICHIIPAWKAGKAGEARYRSLLARRPWPNA